MLAYVAPFTGSPVTISNGVDEPYALAMNAAGNLSVSNYGNNSVTESRPRTPERRRTAIWSALNGPAGLALDAAATSLSRQQSERRSRNSRRRTPGANDDRDRRGVKAFTSPGRPRGTCSSRTPGITRRPSIAPPYTVRRKVNIMNGITKPASGLALNALSDLLVVDFNGPARPYAPPYTGAPTTLSTGLPGNGSGSV